MRDRSEQILRLLCLALLTLLAVQLVRSIFRGNPLAHVTIPAIPTLETNTVTASMQKAETEPKPPEKKSSETKTNAAAKVEVRVNKTNSVPTTNTGITATQVSTNVASTNQSQAGGSNIVTVLPASTNIVSGTTNSLANQLTNSFVSKSTNRVVTVASASHLEKHGNAMPPGMMIPGEVHFTGGPMPMMPGMQRHGPKLSPDIQARVDEIVNSEILAPVMHPLPMGLLGIAGDYAFLRADSGQTGVIQVGEKVGDIKLIRIGINRVLVDQGGTQKELTIFNGYGSESLMNQTNEISK